ncbi:hypothetical protein A3B05_02920 [Candidatus Giovannonibacteria bacterium RIFCSPLOWO2_01_FULL_43_160]|nr:MAG: hypothetical protein A3B05_02920 [Candidatus Giovannonibacteria bacterium RIFCSPLOWO2_01_FULL_43_160]OGF92103.1 MAG: hypothetical protein A3H05_02890 [Candidatus Giovannonibacteria bacterium RIFCSPLOWO2_12_FULL_43_26]
MTKEITYTPDAQKQIERAIVFMIKKIEEHCYNEKPIIMHSLRVGSELMEFKQEKNIVIAGFLHDLLEDTDCKPKEIEKEFGKKVVRLVLACTSDENIKDYKERWRKLVSNIKQAGHDAIIIKLIDQIANLPYYIMISDKQKKQEVMWKHRFFIDECQNNLKELRIFKDYKKMVNENEF